MNVTALDKKIMCTLLSAHVINNVQSMTNLSHQKETRYYNEFTYFYFIQA